MDKAKLTDYLLRVADDKDITPLVARSFGSHMMNLDSDRSDHDIMLVYSQRPEEYVKLSGYTETIDQSFGEDVDISGWNIKKFAELLSQSNPTAMEFLNSPVTHYTAPTVNGEVDELRDYANENFVPVALYHHYRSMGESNYRRYIQRSVHNGEGDRHPIIGETSDTWIVDAGKKKEISKNSQTWEEGALDRVVKRYLYVMRAICYAKYIRKTVTFPNMDFNEFIRSVAGEEWLPSHVYAGIGELIGKKINGEGLDTVDNPHKEFIEDELAYEYGGKRHDRNMDNDRINEFIESVME